MIDFTVVICTYNGAQRLPAVLERLRSQQQVDTLTWEVLVIDNNSSDQTAAVIRQYQANWPAHPPLRYGFEPRQGIAFARRCAIRQSQGQLIGFLDDDNLPEATWVSAAYTFGHTHLEAGAFGSEIKAHFEVAPPPNFHRIASLLAIIERGDTPFPYPRRRGLLPAGAGMVVRRQAWLGCVPATPRLTGVCGQSLVHKGEDVETLTYIRDGGWQVWHNPAMKIWHQVSAERLQPSYLLRLCRAVGYSRFPLRMARYRSWQRPLMMPLYILNDLWRLLRYALRQGQIRSRDVVTLCEWTLLRSSLLSPLVYWQQRWWPRRLAPHHSPHSLP